MRFLAPFAIVVIATATSGCALYNAVHSTSLRDKPVRAIAVQGVAPSGLCPSQGAALAVTARLEDGSELATRGLGRGHVGWKSYTVSLSPAGGVNDGRIYM